MLYYYYMADTEQNQAIKCKQLKFITVFGIRKPYFILQKYIIHIIKNGGIL